MIEVKGYQGRMRLDGDVVEVRQWVGRKASVPIRSVQGIEQQWAGGMWTVRLVVAGAPHGAGMTRYQRARRDPYTVAFLPWRRKRADAFVEAVRAAQRDAVAA